MTNNRTAWVLFATFLVAICFSVGASPNPGATQQTKAQSGTVAKREADATAAADQADRAYKVRLTAAEKIVKGVPYSADITNETIQVLADGNKIDRKTVSTVYRDSQGRLRREEAVTFAGPYQPSAAPAKVITIEDTVAGVRYELHPESKTAMEVQIVRPGEGFHKTGATIDGEPVSVSTNVIADGPALTATGGRGGSGDQPVSADEPVKESLSSQSIDGLYVTGTRVTRTIPAGQIGNEQPISIVTETWYSPDLQIVVMTKHSDPRMGTTTMQLSNISRNEPTANLFTIPADYSVKGLKPSSVSLTVLKEND